ncbi:MAG TPA: flagellar hook-associated protein FlgK [Xanthobacteraceae bacterium]|nr:flagellar hook-associated protein FlgK [Xanthobacteraceae bacterium]
MNLSDALSTALAGLRVTQASLSVTAANVANANTPGYIEESSDQVETAAGNAGVSVNTAGINRELDTLVQGQLRTESSGGAYADTLSQLYQQLQQVYGTPGSSSAVDTAFDNFTTALQNLTTSPGDYSAQSGVLAAAQGLTQNLNAMSSSIQSLRSQCEQGIADDVQQANTELQQIAQINQQLSGGSPSDGTTASLEDTRDQAINQLAQLMDIHVVYNSNNQVSVFTTSGAQLVGITASQLTFDDRGTLSATSLWNANPAQSGVGNIMLVSPDGTSTNLIANNSIKSGQIAAYLQMRDQVLPQAQTQLDELAAQMSEGLSNQTTAGTAVTSGSQSGFDVDVSSLLSGNSIQVTYTNTATNTQQTVTIEQVSDPSALPLPNSPANSNTQVIGVDFSAGMASAINQLNQALGANLQFSNPSGTTLEILNSPTNSAVVNSASTTSTVTSLTSGSPQLPLFLDGTTPISGAITAAGSQDVGLASRITVNPALLADPSDLVTYQTSTAAGDGTRPNFMLTQMTTAQYQFSPTTGIGGSAAPFSGTLTNYLGQVVSQQSQAATNATNLQQGQDAVVSALQQRFNSDSGVNIDQEMSNLISLQNSYAANARVMTTIQQMMQSLLQS